jgi:VanZ family protein
MMRQSLGRRLALWLPPMLYAAFIFHLSSESSPLPDLTEAVWDKALHATEYAGLALLLCRAWRGEGVAWTGAMLFGLAVASAYAATDEWHQSFVPLRDANVLDWFADSVGATAGVALLRLMSPLTDRIDRQGRFSRP